MKFESAISAVPVAHIPCCAICGDRTDYASVMDTVDSHMGSERYPMSYVVCERCAKGAGSPEAAWVLARAADKVMRRIESHEKWNRHKRL